MESDFFIDSYLQSATQSLSKEQLDYIISLETILNNNLRDDFGLLCAVYGLYKTCRGSSGTDKDCVSSAKINKQYRFTELLAQCFGLSERYIYRLVQISGKFINFVAGDKKFKIAELHDYTISKLQELLPLSLNQIELAFQDNELTSKSTREQIRSYVKSLSGSKPDKVIEDSSTDADDVLITEDDSMLVSICIPKDVFDFVRNEILVHKKYASLEAYVISLIREKML